MPEKEKAKAMKAEAPRKEKQPKAAKEQKAKESKQAESQKAVQAVKGKAFVPALTSERTESGRKLSEAIYYPLVSEKAVGAIEAQNKITFIVRQDCSKADVKNAVEKLYGVKVQSIRTLRDMQGRKKAIVRLSKEFKAQELATKLGVV